MNEATNETTPVFETGEAVCRILQVTDFHSDADVALAARTREDVAAMVDVYRPHLLAVTGDIWCSDAEPERAWARMEEDCRFIDSLCVPWAFCRGNHDYAEDWNRAWAFISGLPHSLVGTTFGARVYNLYVCESAKDVHRLKGWSLFFLDSGERWSVSKDDVLMPRESRPTNAEFPPVLAFYHIPLQGYQQAMDEGRARGIAQEEVLCWGDEAGDATAYVKSLLGLRACFCGHSHLNDFSFEEDGITFGYGRVTGYGGYGEDMRRGGKLIKLDLRGKAITSETVFADGTIWNAD